MERALDLVSELKTLENRIEIRNEQLRELKLPVLDYQFVGDLEVIERIVKKTDPDELEIYQIPQLSNRVNRARLVLEKDSENKVVTKATWLVPVALAALALVMLRD